MLPFEILADLQSGENEENRTSTGNGDTWSKSPIKGVMQIQTPPSDLKRRKLGHTIKVAITTREEGKEFQAIGMVRMVV